MLCQGLFNETGLQLSNTGLDESQLMSLDLFDTAPERLETMLQWLCLVLLDHEGNE